MVTFYKNERLKHLLPAEVRLWTKFIGIHGAYFDRFEFDVHVGEGMEVDPAWPANIVAAVYALTAKRIDVVGYRGEEVWLFEIKPDAGITAANQVNAYEALYVRQFGKPVTLYKAIVTERINRDERWLCKESGIRIYVV